MKSVHLILTIFLSNFLFLTKLHVKIKLTVGKVSYVSAHFVCALAEQRFICKIKDSRTCSIISCGENFIASLWSFLYVYSVGSIVSRKILVLNTVTYLIFAWNGLKYKFRMIRHLNYSYSKHFCLWTILIPIYY